MGERLTTGKTKTIRWKRHVPVAVSPPDVSQLAQAPQVIQEIVNSGRRFPITSALPTEQVVPNVLAFTEGSMIDWNAPTAIADTNKQMSENGVLLRAIFRMLDSPPSGEVDLAFDILTADLQRFSPEKSLLASPALSEWWNKFRVGALFSTAVEIASQTQALGTPSPSRAARKFTEEVADQHEGLIKTLRGFNVDDLPLYLRFSDFWYLSFPYRDSQTATASRTEKIITELMSELTLLASELNTVYVEAWKRIKEGWRWPQVREAIAALPTTRSDRLRVHTVAALESNLIDSQRNITNQTGNDLGVADLVSLLKFRWPLIWERYPDLKEKYPELVEHLEQIWEFPPDFSVPRKYLPSTAIELLSQIAQPAELLKRTQLAIERDGEAATPWLLAMATLRRSQPDLRNDIDAMVASSQNSSPAVSQILLDQQPGRLWLTPDGKIHPRAADKVLQRGFPIYVSSAQPVIENSPPITRSQKVTPEQPALNLTHQEVSIPFFEQVQLLRGEITSYIDLMFKKGRLSLNMDQQFAEFEHLSQHWKRSTHDRRLLYLSQFNLSDQYFQRAQRLGIGAVYIKGSGVLFVLRDGVPREALGGTIDKEGQLHLLNTDETFIGEAQHLFFNNLVLHLATQPLHQEGIVEAYKKVDISAVNSLAASWNRSGRNGLPKIGRSVSNPYIVARVEGVKLPVLLGELPK